MSTGPGPVIPPLSRAVIAEIAAGDVITIDQLAASLPVNRRGKPVHHSTVSRMISHGVCLADGSRVKLEAVFHGGRYLTSRAAHARYIAAQNPPMPAPFAPAPRPRPNKKHAADIAEELDRHGI